MKEFKCEACNSEFTAATNLSRHKNKCVKGISYSCICGFSTDRKHRLIHHKEECKARKNIEQLQQQNEQLQQQNEQFQQKIEQLENGAESSTVVIDSNVSSNKIQENRAKYVNSTPERRRIGRSSASIPGLYLIEVGTIGDIKADPLVLPKRRKDILTLPSDMDDHIQYKFGFSKHLDTRMVQHSDNDLRDTSINQTWSWPTTIGMLVNGENYIRDIMRELGGRILPYTTDWMVNTIC